MCVASQAAPGPDAGGDGDIYAELGDQEHEDATCYGGARRRDCFAGFRTDGHAQVGRAEAQPRSGQANPVYDNNHYLGADPDPNVRLDLRRDFEGRDF